MAIALVSLAEDRFLDLAPKLLAGTGGMLRQAAAAGLAKATSPRRMPMLLSTLNDSDPAVWKISLDAVLAAASSDTDKRELVEQIAAQVRTSRNNLGLVVALARVGGDAARNAIWDLVNDPNETNRLVGLHGVGVLNNPEDGPKVTALLQDRSETVKKQACQTIGKMAYPKAVPDLIQAAAGSERRPPGERPLGTCPGDGEGVHRQRRLAAVVGQLRQPGRALQVARPSAPGPSGPLRLSFSI